MNKVFTNPIGIILINAMMNLETILKILNFIIDKNLIII
jgi:hypothetical protein